MSKMNHLDFLHAQTKFLSRYSDWLTYDLLDSIFSDVKMTEGMTYLELFPEYKSRLNYIQKRFNVNATGCEFYDNYRVFFKNTQSQTTM